MSKRSGKMNGAGDELRLPPGFRFFPTDDELVAHYFLPKCAGRPVPVPIIAELDLYKFDPWQLPEMALYGEVEWYFFSPRGRKYPNGSRPNRSAGNGYWKATGADKPVGSPRAAAVKKSLVFYSGKAPNGEKSNWIMHEYRLAGVDRSPHKKSSALRLDDWVLCRIYNKKGAHGSQAGRSKSKLPELKSSPETTSYAPHTMLGDNSSFGSPESSKRRLVGEVDGSAGCEPPWPPVPEAYTFWPEVKRQMRLGGDWTWEEALMLLQQESF